jgi:hypothetical protein
MMRRWRNLSTLPRTWATCTFSGVLEEANRRTSGSGQPPVSCMFDCYFLSSQKLCM